MSADRKPGNHKRVEVRKQPPAKEKHFAIWCLFFPNIFLKCRFSLFFPYFLSSRCGYHLDVFILSVSYLVAHTLLVSVFAPIVLNSCKIKIVRGVAIIIELLFPL